MNFQDLHELLRLELLRRIAAGSLTGTRLAQQTSFQQGHVSNFLNRKRALSLEGLDRVLAAQHITIEEILPVSIAAGAAASTPEPRSDPPPDATEIVPVVAASAALDEPHIQPASVIETVHVAASRLAEIHARPGRRSVAWQRFVALRATGQQAAAMVPTLAPGSIAVIDRHYNSLAPYHPGQPALYAVRSASSLLLRFVELEDGRLILRPSSLDHPVQLIAVPPGESPSDAIVGRVCLLLHEL